MADDLIPSAPSDAPSCPAHVPRELVRDLRFANGEVANDLEDPYRPCDVLRSDGAPRIMYFPWPVAGTRQGGWVVTRYEDIRRVYEDNDVFSTRGAAQFQALAGETFPSIPLGIDPPDHRRYRMFLNPYFSPVAMNEMEPKIRAVAVEMIDRFVDRGEVDIAWELGRVFPVRIFLDLMGLPFSMFEQFLVWEWEILHNRDVAAKAVAVTGVLKYLRSFIAEKQGRPDPTLGSHIANGVIEGKPLTADEVIGMTWFLWLGGLDTVASTISQMFRRLALDQALQRRLRDQPDLIDGAVEEFLRMQPLVNSGRVLKRDLEWHGVSMKEGDLVCCLNTSGNFDEQVFTEPHTFDPLRAPNRHHTFVAGLHTCLGAPLARRELRILLSEFLTRVPEFRVKPGADTTVTPGLLSIRNLPLVWDRSGG